MERQWRDTFRECKYRDARLDQTNRCRQLHRHPNRHVRGTGTNAASGTTDTDTDTDPAVVNTPLPNAVAPTLAVSAPDVDEGGTSQITVTPSGGTYDALSYAYEIVSGPADVNASGLITGRSVTSNQTVTYRARPIATGDGTDAADGSSNTGAWVQGRMTVRNVPVLTTDTDTIYIEAIDQPSTPTGGTSTQTHTPTGWTRTRPAATEDGTIWQATRTRNFTDGSFTSASAWGNVTENRARLLGIWAWSQPADTYNLVLATLRADVSNPPDLFDAPEDVIDGDLEVASDLMIDQIELRTENDPDNVRLRRTGGSRFDVYFDRASDSPLYPDAKLYLQTDADTVIPFTIIASGNSFSNWSFDALSQISSVSGISTGDRFLLAITTPGTGEPVLPVEGSFAAAAGTPTASMAGAVGVVTAITGALAASAGAASATIRGAVAVVGVIAGALAASAGVPSASIGGEVAVVTAVSGALTASAGSPTATIAGTVGAVSTITGAFTASAGTPSATVAGTVGSVSPVEGAFTAAAGSPVATISGTVVSVTEIQGALAASAGIPTATITGAVATAGTITGAFAASAGTPSATIAGTVATVSPVTGALAASAGTPSASITGAVATIQYDLPTVSDFDTPDGEENVFVAVIQVGANPGTQISLYRAETGVGSIIEGDTDVADGYRFDRIWLRNPPANWVTIQDETPRPLDAQTLFEAGGAYADGTIHVQNAAGTVRSVTMVQIGAPDIGSGGINIRRGSGTTDPEGDFLDLLNTLATDDRIILAFTQPVTITPLDLSGSATSGNPTASAALEFGDPPGPLDLAGSATAGNPTASAALSLAPPSVTPVELSGSATAGLPTASATLVFGDSPDALELSGSATAGLPTSSAVLTLEDPSIPALEISGSATAGLPAASATLSLVTSIIAPFELGGSATAGNPTASAVLELGDSPDPLDLAGSATAGLPSASATLQFGDTPDALEIGGFATAGLPTASATLEFGDSPDPLELSGSAAAGLPTASATLEFGTPPTALDLAGSATAGLPTASAVLALTIGAAVELAGSATAGNPTSRAVLDLTIYTPTPDPRPPRPAELIVSTTPEPRTLDATTTLLISQWLNSQKLRSLVQNSVDRGNDIIAAFEHAQIMKDIDEAEGVWLDYIGGRMGVRRPAVTSPADDLRFGFEGPVQSRPFGTAPFRGSSENAAIFPLNDSVFRRMLKARGITLLSRGSPTEFTTAVLLVSSSAVVTDNRDMTITIRTDDFEDLTLADELGCLPRPAGVRIIYETLTAFGFKGAGVGFDQGPFRNS